MRTSAPEVEFDRQLTTLVEKGYPSLAGLSQQDFRARLAPLAEHVAGLGPSGGTGRVPFVIVVRDLVPADEAMALVRLRDKAGFTTMEADDLKRFVPVDEVALPEGMAYLLTDIDTGADTLDVPPAEAWQSIAAAGRSPLTVDEGIALVLHHPDLLRQGSRFSILGSRCGDRRVPAIWVSEGRPRLGWCWEGAPHTWLGSASAGGRMGV